MSRCYVLMLVTQVVVCLAPGVAWGTVYHVGQTDNVASTTEEVKLFSSIGRAMQELGPGDTLVVHAGIYRETIAPPTSGSESARIRIMAAEGEEVVLNGCEALTGWQAEGEGLWKARAQGPVQQIFWDGEMLSEACWPNTPPSPMERVWAEADEGTTPGRILQAELPAVDLTGSTIHVLPGLGWTSWTREVAEHHRAEHTLVFNADWNQEEAYKVAEGTRFYLFGTKELLDTPGEWWYDSENEEIYVIPPRGEDPNEHTVEIKRRDLAVDLRDRAYVSVEGFRIFGATASLIDATHCEMQDCHVRYASHLRDARAWSARNDTGIVVGGAHNRIERCAVLYSAGNGVTLLGNDNTLENCVVRYTNYMATDCGSVWAEGRGNIIRRCTLSHSGRSIIVHRKLKAGIIEYNDLHHAGLMNWDLGITYCFNTDGEGTVIAYNWVHDNMASDLGIGIYLDNRSKNFVVHHNVCWNNTGSGIRLNTPAENHKLYNNTVIHNGDSIDYWGRNDNDDQPGCVAVNNIFTDEVAYGEGMNAHHNYEGETPGIVSVEERDFRLREGSPCIDAGVPIEGITVEVKGSAPDLGAYEHGSPAWKPGHDWGKPPKF